LADLQLQCIARTVDDEVRITLTNGSDTDAWLFAWDTPWDQYSQALDVVDLARGEPLEYAGVRVRRAAPDERAFLHIPAGGQLDGAYPLARAYELFGHDTLLLSVRTPNLRIRVGDQLLTLAHDCGSGYLQPTASESEFVSKREALLGTDPNCTPAQHELIDRVIRETLHPRSALATTLHETPMPGCAGSGTPDLAHKRRTSGY
jgi:hypothetical protein